MCRVFTVLFLTSLFQRTSPDEQWIFRHTGMNVTLTFLVPTSTTSLWLKRFNNEKYISYCRDGQPARPSDQEESFRGRVEGMDCNRINGNVSVIVRNLTCNDSGTYVLHGVDHDERRFNKTVFLIVTDPVNPWLHMLWVGAAVCGVIGLIYKGRCMKPKSISCVSDPRCVKVGLDDDGDDKKGISFCPREEEESFLSMKSDTVVFMK